MGTPLCLRRYFYVCFISYSEADNDVKAEEDFEIPGDTELSAEEDEQLQKKKGEELNLVSSLTKYFNPSTLFLGML